MGDPILGGADSAYSAAATFSSSKSGSGTRVSSRDDEDAAADAGAAVASTASTAMARVFTGVRSVGVDVGGWRVDNLDRAFHEAVDEAPVVEIPARLERVLPRLPG